MHLNMQQHLMITNDQTVNELQVTVSVIIPKDSCCFQLQLQGRTKAIKCSTPFIGKYEEYYWTEVVQDFNVKYDDL